MCKFLASKIINYVISHFSLCQWILVAIQAKWLPIIPLALKFVTDCGRVKYVRACYQRLFEWEKSRKQALECFEMNKPTMHNFTIQFINSLLNNKNKANGKENEEEIGNKMGGGIDNGKMENEVMVQA